MADTEELNQGYCIHICKSLKKGLLGVNKCPSRQTSSDLTKLCLELPMCVLHTLAYLFIPLAKRKMTF